MFFFFYFKIMSDKSKIIYGQAYIVKRPENNKGRVLYSLVQEQTLIAPGQGAANNTVELIGDVVGDLKSEGTYKYNGKNYFYWEYKMTDSENDDVNTTIKYECPQPSYFGDDFFTEEDTIDTVKGEYSKYWINKINTAKDNFEYKAAIQKKEIVFPGTSYVNQKGELVEVKEIRNANTELGDITNLLDQLF